MVLPLLLFTVIVAYVFHYYLRVRKYPKGPFPLPLIGNTYHMPMNNLHEYFDLLSKTYGPCYTLFLPKPTVILTDHRFIKEALATQGDAFTGRSQLPPETLFQKEINTGVLISDGEVWRDNRRVSMRILREFGIGKNVMEEKINKSIDEMMGQLDSLNNKNDVNMFLPIQLCVGNVMNELLFGFHYSHDDCEEFTHFVNVLNDHFIAVKKNRLVWLVQAWPWIRHIPFVGHKSIGYLKENLDKYLSFISSKVEKFESTFDEDSTPSNYIHAYMKEMKKEQSETVNRQNLVACVTDFWLAGMETTSTSLRWHLQYALTFPDVQRKVQDEIDSVIGRDRPPTMNDKAQMPYTQAVLHEILRHSNMIPFLFTHRSTSATSLFGLPIPSDTIVMAQIWSVLAGDSNFKNPEEFKPERFLSEDGKSVDKSMVDRVILFGLGRRSCPGEGLARMEQFLIFTSLLQRYSIVANGPVDVSPIYGTILLPKDNNCRLIERK